MGSIDLEERMYRWQEGGWSRTAAAFFLNREDRQHPLEVRAITLMWGFQGEKGRAMDRETGPTGNSHTQRATIHESLRRTHF